MDMSKSLGFTKLLEKVDLDLEYYLTIDAKNSEYNPLIRTIKNIEANKKRLLKKVNRFTYLLIYFDGSPNDRIDTFHKMEKIIKELDKNYDLKVFKNNETPTLEEAVDIYNIGINLLHKEINKYTIDEITTHDGNKYVNSTVKNIV